MPILPTDEPLGHPVEKGALDQPLEPGPSIPLPPISPVVPSTPLIHSSPSLILTDWTPTPPRPLRTRSSDMEDATRSPYERGVLWKGSAELEGKVNASMTPGDSSPCFLEQGNTTSSLDTRTEQSSTSNGPSLETNEVNIEVLVPSSSQEKLGKQQSPGAGSFRRLQLSPPRRTRAHRGELGTEYSIYHTIPMHLTKQNPAPKAFPPPQPQSRTTSTQGLHSASVGMGGEETSQEVTSSDSIRIPPGQVPVSHESQESRPTPKSTAPGSSFEAFMGGLSWGMTASESMGFPLSGQIAVTRESQEATPISQNMGEAEVSFKAPDPLANRDHRWKSNINAMLPSSPIYATPSAPNSPVVETSTGPMNSMSPSSDGDTAYHQYMEDSRRAEERGDSPASCEEEMGPQSEINELDCASSTSSADESGESDEGTDRQEAPSKHSGAMVGEEEHIKKLTFDVEVDKQHKPSQGVLEAGLTPGPERPPTQNAKRVEGSVQPAEWGEPQESADMGRPDADECDHTNQIHARLACTPVQEFQANFLGEPRAEEVTGMQWEAEEVHQAEAHGETKTDDTMEGQHEAENCGTEGIGQVSPPELREPRLVVESTVLSETAHEELQDMRLQQESLRIHSHTSIPRTISNSLHQSSPQAPTARTLRRLPWQLAESDSRSPSASLSPPPPPLRRGQVLGKRKRISVGDDVREKARTPPAFSSLKMSTEKVNLVEILPRLPVQHQDVIKRRKVEFVDAPLMIEFEGSGSDLEIPIYHFGLKKKRNGKAPAIQVQDGSPFSTNKPSHPPSFAVPSPGERKLQSNRPTLHVRQSASRVVPSTSVKDEPAMTPLVHRPHRVSAHSNRQQQTPTYRVSSRASTRYPSPVSSLFREHQSLGRRPSGLPRHSLNYIGHSDLSESRDDVSVTTTNTLPHVDFLKRKPVPKRRSSSSQGLRS